MCADAQTAIVHLLAVYRQAELVNARGMIDKSIDQSICLLCREC